MKHSKKLCSGAHLHRQEISIHNFTPRAAQGRIQQKTSQFQIMEGKKEIQYGSLTSKITSGDTTQVSSESGLQVT